MTQVKSAIDGKTKTNISTNSNTSNSTSRLTVVIDPGSSGIKVLYWKVGDRLVKYLYVDSEYLVLPSSCAGDLRDNSGLGLPEDNCWVRFRKNGECHLVGRTAIDASASMNYKSLKIDYITAKVAAILGIIWEKEQLNCEFKINLAVLLPLDEITNTKTKKKVKASLSRNLSSFYYRRENLTVELDNLSVVPEGYGAAMYDSHTRNDFKYTNSAYLVCGQKHNSFLYFVNGTFSQTYSKSDRHGFVTLADLICYKVPGLKRLSLLNIFKTTIASPQSESVLPKVRSKLNFQTAIDFNAAGATTAAKLIENCYEQSLPQYWATFSNWLDDVTPPLSEIHSLTWLGGYSPLISDLIRDRFAPIPVYSPSGISDKLIFALGFASNLNSPEAIRFIKLNPIRFADAWQLFAIFSGYLDFFKQETGLSA